MNKPQTTRSDQLLVVARHDQSSSTTEFVLERPDGGRLPDWAPGAHIDVVLPSGQMRQYSLCGDRWNAHQYRIAVQLEEDGTGGSAELHQDIHPGDVIGFGGPRNNFRFVPAETYRFIAGGIGITALLPMIQQADLLNLEWKLLYLGRSIDRMAYRELANQYPNRVTLHSSQQEGRRSIKDWLGELPRETMIYACGPEAMLEALPEACMELSPQFLRTERFTNTLANTSVSSETYEVELKRSGKVIQAPGTSPLTDVLQQSGVDVITSCSKGVCGTCEVGVLEGKVDHRDAILDDEERSDNACMFPCVSRALSKRLVLDL